jgi:hypothetical protein
MSLAPILLFVYNRPRHTKEVLDALAANLEAKDSNLYIYCDGAKDGASDQALSQIGEVRRIVRAENRFSQVNVIEHDKNKGLAKSIIDGVTEVVTKYGEVIVLEDDILVSLGFLKYMNDALRLYSNDDRVGCIHAWNYNLDSKDYTAATFFLKGADCWGWATWKRAWERFNPDGSFLLESIKKDELDYEFNRKGTHNFLGMLKDQIAGKNDSWAIRWHASLFIDNLFCLHPVKPIIRNIGLDNSGVHCGALDLDQQPIDYIVVNRIDVIEDELFFKLYRNSLVQEKRPTTIERMKHRLQYLFKR